MDMTLDIVRFVGRLFGIPSHRVLRLFVVVDSDSFDVCLLFADVWADSAWLGMCAVVGDCMFSLLSVSQQPSVGRHEQESCDTLPAVLARLRGSSAYS